MRTRSLHMDRSAYFVCSIAIIFAFLNAGQYPQTAQAKPPLVETSAAQWQCYDDGSLDPCHNDLFSVSFLNASEGWAVGNTGKILRYHNELWSAYPSPVSDSINQVQTLAVDDAWAVGGDDNLWYQAEVVSPPILHWDGNAWAAFPLTTLNGYDVYLTSLFMLNANEGWAVGHAQLETDEDYDYISALLLHWNGSDWQQVSLGDASADWYFGDYSAQVWASAANDIWIFSESTLHWDGSAWSEIAAPVQIDRISALAADNIWGIGLNEEDNACIVRWDGETWAIQSNPAVGWLDAISMQSDTKGWAIGSNPREEEDYSEPILLTWDGVSWTETPLPGRSYINSTAAPDAQHAWAVGESGTILQWDGSNWVVAEGGNGADMMVDLALLSPTDGWAVGLGGRIKRYNGTTWQDWPSPTTRTLWTIDIQPGNDPWAIGEEVFLHWDATLQAWEDVTDLQPDFSAGGAALGDMENVYLPNFGWSACDGGICRTYWDADTDAWKRELHPLPFLVWGVYFVSPTDGWLGGGDDFTPEYVYHWNGTTWIETDFDDGGLDHAELVGFATDDVWIIGERTAHWDGTEWSTWLSQYGRGFHDLDKVGQEDYFAVGYNGLAHWNSSGTTNPPMPVDCSMDSIDMLSLNEGWAVGYYCPLIHFHDGSAVDGDYQIFFPLVQFQDLLTP